MWWIFEGADLVGKTSLAKEFGERIKRPYFNGFGRPEDLRDEEAWRRYRWKEMNFLESLIKRNVENLILDRVVWISELAYAPVFGRKIDWSCFDRGKSWNIRMVIVYCYCSFAAKTEREKLEEKYALDFMKDKKIHRNYLDTLSLLPPRPIIRLDTSNSDIFQTLSALLKMAELMGWIKEDSFWPYHASIELDPRIRRKDNEKSFRHF